MRRVALRGLLARKLRLGLTALAVALGVTLIAGTYIYTDTINKAFGTIFTESNRNTDVALSPNDDLAGQGDPPPIPASVLAKVRQVPGVALAEGAVFAQGGAFRKADGSKLKGQGFNAIAGSHDVQRFETFAPTVGHLPKTDDEVAIPKSTADQNGFKVGDRLLISADAPKKAYVISGIVTIAGLDSFGGGVIAVLTLPEAQRMTGHGDAFDAIDVAAAPGVSPQQLRDRIAKVVPATVQVRTGEQQAAKQKKDIGDAFLNTLRTALLAFAGISLFVGAFLIFNTFSITVAQRTREFALLRVLGAKRKQILRTVLAEGLTIGLIGSAVGLGLGILVAGGLKALFQAVGLDLPAGSLALESRTVIVSLLVGTIVTLLASMAPAVRATRVPPIAALREGLDRPAHPKRWATPAALALALVGIGVMAVGLFAGMKAGAALSYLGLGAALTFLGVAFLSPRLVPPIAGLIGRPFEAARGITGRLARENTIRHPGRTAVTAAALMVGVTLVTFASVFAGSAKSTFSNGVREANRAQAIVEGSTGGGGQPFSAEAIPAISQVPGVDRVSAVRFGQARLDGGKRDVTSVDPASFGGLYHSDWAVGSAKTPSRLDDRSVIVSKKYAEDHSIKVGQTLTIETSKVPQLPLTVIGIIHDKGGLTSALTVSNAVMERDFGVSKVSYALVGYRQGVSSDAVKAGISRVLDAHFPVAEVKTGAEFIKQQAGQIDQLLALIYALLALAVIVSLFGIVNTLVLSIAERVRELGLLRAIGMTRRQIKRVIRYEAIITALIGAVIGLALGLVLSVLVTSAIDDFELTIPVVSLVALVVLTAIAGVFAAVLPARRAAKLDVLASLAYE
jgi:putative ABC transport system permease protein